MKETQLDPNEMKKAPVTERVLKAYNLTEKQYQLLYAFYSAGVQTLSTHYKRQYVVCAVVGAINVLVGAVLFLVTAVSPVVVCILCGLGVLISTYAFFIKDKATCFYKIMSDAFIDGNCTIEYAGLSSFIIAHIQAPDRLRKQYLFLEEEIPIIELAFTEQVMKRIFKDVQITQTAEEAMKEYFANGKFIYTVSVAVGP